MAKILKPIPIDDIQTKPFPDSLDEVLVYDKTAPTNDKLKKTPWSNVLGQIASGIKGTATASNSPTAYVSGYLFERWNAPEAITYNNFKDAALNPISVTAPELAINDVFIDVTNGVAKKVLSEKRKGLDGADGTDGISPVVVSVLDPTDTLDAINGQAVADYAEDILYTEYPNRENAGENTTNPQYFKAVAQDGGEIGISIVADTESPTKDVLPFKRVLSNTVVADRDGAFRSINIAVGTDRPNLVSISYWVKKSEYEAIYLYGNLITRFCNEYFPLSSETPLTGGEPVNVINNPANVIATSVTAKLKVISTKIVDGIEFIRLRYNFSDIVWKVGFVDTTIPFYIDFQNGWFFNKEISIYDFTILFNSSAKSDIIYSDPIGDFIGNYNFYNTQKEINTLKTKVNGLYSFGYDFRGKRLMVFGDSMAGRGVFQNQLIADFEMVDGGNYASNGATYNDDTNAIQLEAPYDGTNNTIANEVRRAIQAFTPIGQPITWTHPKEAYTVTIPTYLGTGTNLIAPDIILLEGGTNGAETSDLDTANSFSSVYGYTYQELTEMTGKTLRGSARWAVETLQIVFPNAVIFLMAPLQANYDRPYASQNAKSIQLKQISDMMAVQHIDGTNESGICERYETKLANGRYLEDGLHQNLAGIALYVRYLKGQLINKMY